MVENRVFYAHTQRKKKAREKSWHQEPRKEAKEGRPIKQPNKYAYGVDVTLLCLKEPVVRSMYNLVSSYYPSPPHCTAILPFYNRSALLLHSTCTKTYSIINPEIKFDHRGE